jgi:hypothetical protein
VTDEKSQATRDIAQWTIVIIAIIGAWLTVTFTSVTRQIPLPPIATAIFLAIFYWRLVAGIVSVYVGYRSRFAKLKAKRAASVSKPRASASEKSE